MSSSLSQQVELDHLNNNNNNNSSNTTTATNATTMYATGSHQMMTGLQELASSLNASAARLQDEWHDLSQQQQQSPLLLPDPIKLLRRIQGLETAVANLQTVCGEMAVRRQVAVHNAVEQLDVLRQLLVENGGEEAFMVAQGNDQSPGQEERMKELESIVQAGYQQFVLHNQDGDGNQGGGDES